MKKLLSLLLTLVLALSLAACSSLPNGVGDLVGNKDDGDTATKEPDSNAADDDQGVGYPVDGQADGFLGDTMHTYFFDFTINSAYTCSEFDGLVPDDGFKFLVAEITIDNTTRYTQPMYVYDFQVQWVPQDGEDEELAYDWPLFEEVGDGEYASPSDEQLPAEWELGIKESRTGILLYAVPAGAKDYSISFQEYLVNSSGEETVGDLFFVWFNADEQA